MTRAPTRPVHRMLRPGWFRQNRVALLAVLVLLPTTLGIMFAYQWLGYFEQWPSRPVDVAAGDSVEYGRSEWRIESTDRFGADSVAGTERDLPGGTDLIVITVRVVPSGTGTDEEHDLCAVRLEETGGGNPPRSWTNASGGAVPLAGTAPERTSCSRELRTPYTFDAQFVVPADTGDWAALTLAISVDEELPEYARFTLD